MPDKFEPVVRLIALAALLATSSSVLGKPAQPQLLVRGSTTASADVCSQAFDRNRSKIGILSKKSDSEAIVALMRQSGCSKVSVPIDATATGTGNPNPLEWWIVCRIGFRYLCIFGTGDPPKEYFN